MLYLTYNLAAVTAQYCVATQQLPTNRRDRGSVCERCHRNQRARLQRRRKSTSESTYVRYVLIFDFEALLCRNETRYLKSETWLRSAYGTPHRMWSKSVPQTLRFRHCNTVPMINWPLNRAISPEALQPLRSSARHRLIVPRTRLCTIVDRAFGVAASRVWNSLPPVVTSASSLPSFKRQLKTFLFQNSFL